MRAFLIAMLFAGPVSAQSALPFDVGGAYALTDHNGQTRTQVDPEGLPQLLFFGYANCPGICSAALPLLADTVDILAGDGIKVRPLMITVDPKRDTVEDMGPLLAEYHDDLLGLTGTPAALDVAYKAFSVDHKIAYEDPEYGAIYTHGSLVYLLDGAGEVLTLFPPVMDADKAANVVRRYIQPAG